MCGNHTRTEDEMDFYSKIRKLGKSALTVLLIVLGIFGAIFCFIGYRGVIYQFSEPVDLDEAVFDGLEENMYVKGELKMSLGEMAEYTTTYESGGTTTDAHLYLFMIADEDFENFKYIPVYVPHKDKDKADKIVAQTNASIGFFGGFNEEKLTDSYEFEGVIKELSSSKDKDEKGVYEEVARDLELYEEEKVDFLVNSKSNRIPMLIAFVIGLLFFAGAGYCVFLYTGAFSTKKVKEFITEKNLEGREAYLMNDFDNATMVTKQVRLGREYAYYSNGLRVNMLAYVDIVWAYVDVIKSKNSITYQLTVVKRDKKREKIGFNAKNLVDMTCEAILAANPGIMIGKDKENAEMFRNNFDELVRMVDEKRMSAAEQLDGDNYTRE